MNTMTMPRMTLAQAMVGMYRAMPKKARTEFAEWFFQNVEMDVTQSERCVASAKDNEDGRQQIRNGECTVCRTEEELDDFFDAL